MLDAAEEILREQGHALLTSRGVAEHLGLKQRLVYYYFRTMDELIVETFRRLSLRELERLNEAQRSERPLRAIWDMTFHAADPRLISEFMALAGRVEALRTEVIRFIQEQRKIQVAALSKAMRGPKSAELPSPAALAILANSVALALHHEAALGVREGHAEMTAVVGSFITQWDTANEGR